MATETERQVVNNIAGRKFEKPCPLCDGRKFSVHAELSHVLLSARPAVDIFGASVPRIGVAVMECNDCGYIMLLSARKYLPEEKQEDEPKP